MLTCDRRLEPPALFITFTTYGTWLHGDERGSVDRSHNRPGMPLRPGNFHLRRNRHALLRQPPFILGPRERTAVDAAIREVCAYRQWDLHALNVRSSHLHAVVVGDANGKRAMNEFKAYATRRLVREGTVPPGRRVWTEGGSVRIVRTVDELERVCWCVNMEQGIPLPTA
jgi:REP element-mobilizing transposase RayT